MVGRRLGLLVLGSMAVAFGLAAPAAAQTKKIGTFGGWAISIVHAKGRFVRCVADTTGLGNEGLRMSFGNDGRRQFVLPGPVLENSFTDVFFESKRMEVHIPARNVTRSFDLGNPDTMSTRIDGCMTSHQ